MFPSTQFSQNFTAFAFKNLYTYVWKNKIINATSIFRVHAVAKNQWNIVQIGN